MNDRLTIEAGESFGERLRRAYTEKGYTRASFAEASGLAYNTIHRWEEDATSPTLDNALRAAVTLGVTLAALVGEDEAPRLAEEKPSRVFGERLEALMDAAGIRTKREFMDQVGISAMTLRRYETGEREPSASTIVAMTKALGCSADVLLGLDTPEAETIRAIVRSEVRAEVRSALSDVLTVMARAAERGAL